MKNSDVAVVSMGKTKNNLALPYDFSLGQVLAEAWKRVGGSKATYWKGMVVYVLMLLGLFIVGGAINYVLRAALGPTSNVLHFVMGMWNIITYLIAMPTMVGFSYLAIRRSANLAINVKQIFFPYKHYLRVVGSLALILLIVYGIMFLGFIIIGAIQSYFSVNGNVPPGVAAFCVSAAVLITLIMYYFSLSFIFAPLLIVEKSFTIVQAMKASFFGFNQHWFKILITQFCMMIIYIISAIPLGIGIIWTVPMLFNLIGIFYRIIFGVEGGR
jgi:hypothetical protein